MLVHLPISWPRQGVAAHYGVWRAQSYGEFLFHHILSSPPPSPALFFIGAFVRINISGTCPAKLIVAFIYIFVSPPISFPLAASIYKPLAF